jgi:hypothetical protein
MRGPRAGLCVAALALATAAPAAAADADAGTLSDADGQVRWQGARFVDSIVPTPQACRLGGCDEFQLDVELPAGTWDAPGGVQVGVRWGEEGQDIDLYVYGPDDPDRLAASSTGVYGFAAAQSVLLPRAANGRYRVVVVPVNASQATYAGVAEVERPPAAQPLRDLLPNMVSLAPRHPTFSTGAYLVPHGAGEAASCYPEETAEQGARRCLRFDQGPANAGEGPLELRYRMDDPTDPQLRQRIHRSDGTYRDRVADTYELHPTHAHFHYRNFLQSHLWRSNERGERLGDAPVRSGRKNGFCVIDVDNTSFGSKGDAAKTYGFPRCQAPTDADADGTYMTNGISAGWADVYPWFLADQYIEVSGVPDGHYVLESVADPADTIVESDESDNSAAVLIRLAGDSAEVVAPAKRARRRR